MTGLGPPGSPIRERVGTLVNVPQDPAWGADGRVFVQVVLSRVAGP